MEPISFGEANQSLAKPNNSTDEECGPLAVYTDGTVCTSCWKLSLRERISALIFGVSISSTDRIGLQRELHLWDIIGYEFQYPLRIE